MKALTEDEQYLLDYVHDRSKAFKVYKYYETDEEERSLLPDIWDKLQDDLDAAKDEYDEVRLEYSRKDAQSAVWYHYRVHDAEMRIKLCERLIQRVTDSDADYFLYDEGECIAIRRESRPVYETAVENECLVLIETEDTADVWVPEEKFGYSSFYPVRTKSGAVAMIDCNEPVSNGLYVFVQSDISDLDLYNLNRYNKWFVCVDCGEIYSLSNGEILSYRKKNYVCQKDVSIAVA